ncbi:MAG: NAD(P)-binding domain-containing protein, partial [Chloroflexota bacterium]
MARRAPPFWPWPWPSAAGRCPCASFPHERCPQYKHGRGRWQWYNRLIRRQEGEMKVGFIGLGNMGKPMASNVLKAGFDITVYDIRPEPVAELVGLGAKGARSSQEVARASEMVFTSLPKPSDVEQVVLGEGGVLAGAARGGLMVDMSTNSPLVIQRIAARAAEEGVEVLDAPVTGGIRGAKKGTLTIMVGGSPKGFERARPVLAAMGSNVY